VHLPQSKNGFEKIGKEMAENLCKFRTSSRAQMKRVQITREPMPYGKVLIVDDVETNIYVAKGILSPYTLQLDAASSGFITIDKVKEGNVYDIIFMDHMMPKMDGVETTQILRSMGYTNPIVALTANAVSGQADIFLGNGFDDFISKPIDVRQLNNVLNKFIRDKQPQEVIDAARRQAEINEIARKQQQTAKPIEPEQEAAIDSQFAEVFVRDALKALGVLEDIVAKDDYSNTDNIRTYIINVHGMKSALANIGKMDLSMIALKLEAAGRDGNLETVVAETPGFIKALRAFVEEMTPAKQDNEKEDSKEEKERLFSSLQTIRIACEDFDKNSANVVLTELRKSEWSVATEELLSEIAEMLLHSDFDEIVEKIDALGE